jgi:hypothetical protein
VKFNSTIGLRLNSIEKSRIQIDEKVSKITHEYVVGKKL